MRVGGFARAHAGQGTSCALLNRWSGWGKSFRAGMDSSSWGKRVTPSAELCEVDYTSRAGACNRMLGFEMDVVLKAAFINTWLQPGEYGLS